MFNFMDESDILPAIKSKPIEVTTDYNRLSSLTRYASGLLLERLERAGKIHREKISPETWRVRSTA
jgi:hypothetical protein